MTLKFCLLAAALTLCSSAFAQGRIVFNNRQIVVGSGPNQPVVAPVFGVDPADPFLPKKGNPAATWNGTSGPTPAPPGNQTYGGTPLHGTGFTAQLWACNANKPDDQLQPIATTTFRTVTTVTLQGFILPPSLNPPVPDTPSDSTSRAKFQLRVWDNQSGTILTWDQALQGFASGTAIGSSDIFTVDFQLGEGTFLSPNLVGLQSFQLYVVPEPSVIALSLLGTGCLFFFRRRSNQQSDKASI